MTNDSFLKQIQKLKIIIIDKEYECLFPNNIFYYFYVNNECCLRNEKKIILGKF